MHPERCRGIVKWFSRVRGYGFILPADGGEDVFVHHTAIMEEGYRNLYEGERVAFDLVDDGRGPKALAVCKLRGGL